jgi:Flp pilus assembly protein TadD
MGDLIKVASGLISLIPQFPGWLRWFHYMWVFLAFSAAFSTLVWYTSPSTAPTRVREEAKTRQPSVPIELQIESLDELKSKVRSHQEQGLTHMERREFEQAIDVFQRAQVYLNQALIRAPEDLYVQNLRGYMLKDWAQVSLFLGKETEAGKLLDEAADTFHLIIKQDSNDAGAHNGMGSVYAIRGDLDRAEKEIRTALRLMPDYEAAQDDLKLVEKLRRLKQ